MPPPGRRCAFPRAIPLPASIAASPPIASMSAATTRRRSASARESLRQRPDFVGAHRVLTASLGMSGHPQAAAAALEALRQVQPNISLAWLASEMPFEHEAEREHYLEGFRRAGLG